MSVVLAVEESGPCEKKLKIEVPAATVEAETNRIAGEFRGQANLPGFRKGKVPMEIVRKRFGEEIHQEVLERLVPRFWHQAQAEAQLTPLLPPSVEDVSLLAGAPLTFTAVVEVSPEFPLAELEGFNIPPLPGKVTEGELERALEDVRRNVAPWVDTEMPAAQGTLVEAKLGELREGADEPAPVSFEVGDPNIWEELSLEATGKKVGQTGTFTRSEPGSEDDEPVVKEYSLEVTAIKERELPDLDDALAKKVAGFDTLDELKADMTQRLDGAKQQEGSRLREKTLLDQLRERNPTGLPQRVVEQEIRQMLTDYAEGLGARGVDPNKADIDWQHLSEQVKPQAEARVHARLLLDAVAVKLEVDVPEEVFEATLAGLARSQGHSAAQLRQSLDREGRLGELRAQLLRERALRRLMGEEENLPAALAPDSADAAEAEEEEE